ncbi:hypothetical protein CR513_04524, partial [Mucuna pruriens]
MTLFIYNKQKLTIFSRIMGATSAKEAWNTLQEDAKVRIIKLQTLCREFELIKMKESKIVKDYYSKIKEIYDATVTTIEQTKDLSTLLVTKLMSSLKAYKQRMNRHNEDYSQNKKHGENSRNGENSRSFSKNNQDKYPPCGIFKKTSHLQKDFWHCGNPQCQYYEKSEYVEKNCCNKNKHQTNFIKNHDNEQHLFYATRDSSDETKRNWHLDSNCSNHMAKDRSMFKDIDDSVKVKETAPWWSQKEKSPSWWRQKKGMRFIKDILLVANLRENLLSIDQMMERSYALHFEGDICTIYNNYNKRQEFAQVKMEKRNRSFPTSFKYTTNIVMKVEVDDSWLRHRRFGHFNS